MTSTWGNSWGSAWGGAWGSIAQVVPEEVRGGRARPAAGERPGRPLQHLLAEITRNEKIERRRLAEAAEIAEVSRLAEIATRAGDRRAEAMERAHVTLSAPIEFDTAEVGGAIVREDYTDLMWVLLLAA